MRINKIDLGCRDGDLFCLFCGAKIWNSENPDDLDICEHFIFSYGQGEFQVMNSFLIKALQDIDLLDEDIDYPVLMNKDDFQKTLVVCNKIFANFMVFSEDMVGDLSITAIAELH